MKKPQSFILPTCIVLVSASENRQEAIEALVRSVFPELTLIICTTLEEAGEKINADKPDRLLVIIDAWNSYGWFAEQNFEIDHKPGWIKFVLLFESVSERIRFTNIKNALELIGSYTGTEFVSNLKFLFSEEEEK